MIVNPDKFRTILLDKRKSNNTEVKSIIGANFNYCPLVWMLPNTKFVNLFRKEPCVLC